jgi:hypothetical protein
MDAEQVLQYVKKTHGADKFNIEYSITDHPEWQLVKMPLSQLNLDPDGEQQDPYNRTNWVDYDVVRDLMPKIVQVLESKPIVVDSQGWIIDGNHRAMAAVEAGLTSVPALVPVQQDMSEGLNFDEIYGKYLKVTDNSGDPGKPGFSLVTPLNGESWNWRERPEFKDLVKQKLNDPGFLGDHKYQQIIDAMSDKQFDPTKHIAKENFHDGRNPGRKGLAKRSGVNTKASVSSLRKTAKNSSGEKQRMAHWLANMKAGRAKAKRK